MSGGIHYGDDNIIVSVEGKILCDQDTSDMSFLLDIFHICNSVVSAIKLTGKLGMIKKRKSQNKCVE